MRVEDRREFRQRVVSIAARTSRAPGLESASEVPRSLGAPGAEEAMTAVTGAFTAAQPTPRPSSRASHCGGGAGADGRWLGSARPGGGRGAGRHNRTPPPAPDRGEHVLEDVLGRRTGARDAIAEPAEVGSAGERQHLEPEVHSAAGCRWLMPPGAERKGHGGPGRAEMSPAMPVRCLSAYRRRTTGTGPGEARDVTCSHSRSIGLRSQGQPDSGRIELACVTGPPWSRPSALLSAFRWSACQRPTG